MNVLPSPSENTSDNNGEPDLSPPKRQGRYAGTNLRPPTSKSVVNTSSKPQGTVRRFSAVPQSLLFDEQLKSDMSSLPPHYSFEVPKTIHRLREAGANRVALQMPEGLLMYGSTLSDIIRRHTAVTSTVLLADVTYGACCVDDLSATALSCDFLVHYGHSCLIPITTTRIPMLYVFVHISFDTTHLRATLQHNFPADMRIALVATIQFVDTAHDIRDSLKNELPNLFVPQKRPLSPGELLGCTAPVITDADVMVYIGDGRFHLESAMIANPDLSAYRYDPYSKRLTKEGYATFEMRSIRKRAIDRASNAQKFGIILGTLGRQGSPLIMRRLMKALREENRHFFVVLLSEIAPAKLARLEETGVQAWIQIACPRLSIDWGENFSDRPLLNPYESLVALGKIQWHDVYPMDYYAKDGGEWSNYFKEKRAVSKANLQLSQRKIAI